MLTEMLRNVRMYTLLEMLTEILRMWVRTVRTVRMYALLEMLTVYCRESKILCVQATPFLSMKLPPPFSCLEGINTALRAGRGGPREGQTNTEGVSSWGKLWWYSPTTHIHTVGNHRYCSYKKKQGENTQKRKKKMFLVNGGTNQGNTHHFTLHTV
jgi:hypothetical protein